MDIIFNPEKSKCLHFKSKTIPINYPHNICIDGKSIKYSNSEEYLGHIIQNNRKDDEEIFKQRRRLYIRGNSLICKSEETRAKPFISFCSNLYLSSLWSRYTNVNT